MLNSMNWKRGLLRLWVVFTLAWTPWWGYQAWEANKSVSAWRGLVQDWSGMANRARHEADQAPSSHPGGLSKSFYETASKHYMEELENAALNRDQAEEDLEKSVLFLPVPLCFLLFYPVVRWVTRGFK